MPRWEAIASRCGRQPPGRQGASDDLGDPGLHVQRSQRALMWADARLPVSSLLRQSQCDSAIKSAWG
jgi:hypothetical protein